MPTVKTVEVNFTFVYADKRRKYTSKDFGIKSIPYGEGDETEADGLPAYQEELEHVKDVLRRTAEKFSLDKNCTRITKMSLSDEWISLCNRDEDDGQRDLEWELSSDFNTSNILFVTDYDAPKVSVKISDVEITDNELDEFERNIIATVRYNIGADFDGNGKLDFYDWYGELSKTNNIPTLKQLKFIEDIEDETGETFRGFTKEAATKFISNYVDNRESYDDYMGNCLNY